jgi:hypothetical protein
MLKIGNCQLMYCSMSLPNAGSSDLNKPLDPNDIIGWALVETGYPLDPKGDSWGFCSIHIPAEGPGSSNGYDYAYPGQNHGWLVGNSQSLNQHHCSFLPPALACSDWLHDAEGNSRIHLNDLYSYTGPLWRWTYVIQSSRIIESETRYTKTRKDGFRPLCTKGIGQSVC